VAAEKNIATPPDVLKNVRLFIYLFGAVSHHRWNQSYDESSFSCVFFKLVKAFKHKMTRLEKSGPRFIMVGGFLGAGKTTTLLRLAHWIQQSGKKVGIVTNDQAAGLVDTELIGELDLPVREITGGCFCCNSESLVDALKRLSQENKPDVFIAEPVGSCTDLIATVSLPLQQIYNTGFSMAPYAVVVDPYRAMQCLGIGRGPSFATDVKYIYRKQLEEAEIIVINKADVFPDHFLAQLMQALSTQYPDTRIMVAAARDGLGLPELFAELLSRDSHPQGIMDVDYERYARGEALLGWYNGKFSIEPGPAEFDGNAWILRIADRVREELQRSGIEIAHFKMSLAHGTGAEGLAKPKRKSAKAAQDEAGNLAAVSLVNSSDKAELRRTLKGPLSTGILTVNLRAEGAPDFMAETVRDVLNHSQAGVRVECLGEEWFRPAPPSPTYRVCGV
jgi:G3E family GTPase